MDIRNFFGSSSSKSATPSLREVSSGSESEEDLTSEAPPSKRPCAVPSSAATSRKYKKWETDFPWLEYDGNFQSAFCKICRKAETGAQSSQGSGGVWITKPFQNWKKAVQKMKAHASSEFHVRQVEAELLAN